MGGTPVAAGVGAARGDADYLRLTIGYGDLAWSPDLAGDPDNTTGPVAAVLAGYLLPAAPLTLDLSGRVLGLVGDRVNALELGRGLLCSAAVLHGPSDLAVAVVTDRPADWDWVKWLPHVMVAPTDRRRLLAGDAIETVAVLDWIATRPGAGQQRPVVLVVVDRGPLTDPPGLAVRRVLGGATGDMAGIVLADGADDLPAECTDLVDCGHRRARLTTGEGSMELAPAGVVAPVAVTLARGLASYRDPDQVDPGAGLPRAVRLLEAAGSAGPSSEELIGRWSDGGAGLDAVLGVTATGPMHIDLAHRRPARPGGGTTGAGKSELLRTLVASLALSPAGPTSPSCWSTSRAAAHSTLRRLPHTVGLVTDLDGIWPPGPCAASTPSSATASGCFAPAVQRPGALRPRGRLPRLVIVIDEFAPSRPSCPGSSTPWSISPSVAGASGSTSCWPPSGRPGVVNGDIRANTNLRVALRVTAGADSPDVLGTRRPPTSSARPVGAGPPRRRRPGPLQAATVCAGPATAAPVAVRPSRTGPIRGVGRVPGGPLPKGPSRPTWNG